MGTLSSNYPNSNAVEAALDRANSAAHEITLLSEDIIDIKASIDGKASQSDLEALQTAVEDKADTDDLTALAATVSGKADEADLTVLAAEVDTKTDNSDFTSAVTNLQAQIDQIEISASAEAVVAPEVLAARVGADGRSYQTLKQRLDSESIAKDSAIANVRNSAMDSSEVDISNFTINNWGISGSSGIWGNNNNWQSIFIPVSISIEFMSIKAKSTSTCILAQLKTMPVAEETTPDYATGGYRQTIDAGETAEITIAPDCRYLWVNLSYGENDHAPDKIFEYESAKDRIDAQMESLTNTITETIIIDDYSEFTMYNWGISSNSGKWVNTSNWQSIFQSMKNIMKVVVTANSEYNTAVAQLKTMPVAEETTPDYATGGYRQTIDAGETAEITIAPDCQYLWVYISYGENDHAPDSITELKYRETEYKTIPLNLHTMPETEGQLNLIKRCRQMTDIKWTPAVDLPRRIRVQRSFPYPDTTPETVEGVFKAGVEYTGIPYGRANDISTYDYAHGYVGCDINFDTFITAIENSGSIVSKESRYDVQDHASTIYAAVCSALVSYALNVSYHETARIPEIQGLSFIQKIDDNGTRINPTTLRLGDVLNDAGVHAAIITDIIKDNNGDVVAVEISEATSGGLADKNYSDGQIGGVCRRKGWAVDAFFDAWKTYSLYRYNNIANIPYTPSPYVNVGDEMDMFRVEHFPCMPYMGENFTYIYGNIPNTDIIIAPDLGYDYLRVFKDGVEIANSPFTVESDTEKISVGFNEKGNYEAYLCKMSSGSDTVMSYKCHWKVRE